jgi:SAM-dependent methyltransferase
VVPRLIITSLGAPRSQPRAWERYWSGVRRTGPHGEVLWDTDEPAEFELAAEQLRRHADLTLPMVDLGCGSGRQARALTGLAPRVVAVDASAAALAHARREGAGGPVDYRVGDVTEPGFGARLAAELGDANVHISGVLHVPTDEQRAVVTETVAALLGSRGTLYLCETDQAGDPLDYLIAQGRGPPTCRPPYTG